jgi:hypothetical protein
MNTLVAAQPKSPPNKTMSDKDTATSLAKVSNMGRPTDYSLELASKICELIADGNPLRRICKREDMPSAASVYLWLSRYKDFSDMYARAREDQADALADEIVEIADEQPELVPMYDKDGQLVEIKIDTAFMAWQKNRMDARKWTASKLKPRKWGDRQIVAGDDDAPLQLKHTSEVLDTLLINMQLKRQITHKG